MGFLGATASFALVGPLIDRLLVPAVGTERWEIVAPLVGQGPAAGIGLLQAITGAILLLLTALTYALPGIRHLEATLPDYEALVTQGAST